MPPAPGLQIFRRLPWNGGINTSADESVISPNDLVLADNIEFTTEKETQLILITTMSRQLATL